jgi:hypothetical protein
MYFEKSGTRVVLGSPLNGLSYDEDADESRSAVVELMARRVVCGRSTAEEDRAIAREAVVRDAIVKRICFGGVESRARSSIAALELRGRAGGFRNRGLRFFLDRARQGIWCFPS